MGFEGTCLFQIQLSENYFSWGRHKHTLPSPSEASVLQRCDAASVNRAHKKCNEFGPSKYLQYLYEFFMASMID